MISSNLVFSQWDQIIEDPLTIISAIHRLMLHAVILDCKEGRRDDKPGRPPREVVHVHLDSRRH